VHDGFGPGQRGPDAFTGEQVTGHVLNAVLGFLVVPAEHSDMLAGLL
jgi:hypothetical protein